MASLDKKIEAYMGRSVDFLKEVTLQDDGKGAYIAEWNIKDKANAVILFGEGKENLKLLINKSGFTGTINCHNCLKEAFLESIKNSNFIDFTIDDLMVSKYFNQIMSGLFEQEIVKKYSQSSG